MRIYTLGYKKNLKSFLGYLYYNFYKKYKISIGNRILIYHAFGTKLTHDSYGISINKCVFKEHISFIKDNYLTSPIKKEVFNNINDTTVSISIDDGYKDNLNAVEILEEYNIPYTIFIIAGKINKNGYLSSDDINFINRSSLATIGSHTVNHFSLKNLNYTKLSYELLHSKKILEDIIGETVFSFSYPYGHYSKLSQRLTPLYYNVVCCSHSGQNLSGCSLNLLKRTEIVAHDNVSELEKKILGYYDFKR